MPTLLAKSNYWKMASINAALRGQNFTAPTTVFAALYTTDPTGADTGTEVSGGGYARQPVTFTAPSLNGQVAECENSAEVSFPVAAADQGLIGFIGIRTALTGGNLLYAGALENPRTILASDQARFEPGDLLISEG